MRNLAADISEKFLPRAKSPGQYIGLEINACNKDMHQAQVHVVLAYPDTYSIGISHLGHQILYHMLNATDGVACDRAYCPPPDAEAIMRRQNVPLFGWESRCAVADFDILGFSLSYEMCATNVLTMLDLAGVPVLAADRSDAHPIVIAGDAMADNPEPVADFIDLFIIGDGEEPLAAIVQLVKRMKSSGTSREQIILDAARTIPSVYAPAFYRPRYNQDGTFGGMETLQSGLPEVIHRAHIEKLSGSPAITRPLVPLGEAIHDRVVIEIMRGCPNACRFCQAGATRLPLRWRSVDEIINTARAAISATGYREISLLSLSTSDYPHLEELIERLNAEFAPQNVSLSLPSLRVDQQLQVLPRLTSTVRKGGLTIAAEAGSDRLRKALRKNITEEDMIAGVRAAYQAGWKSVKVYFMAGLPGETPDDIDAIYRLCRRLSDARKDVDNQRGAISASVSWFVPKPHTPMQWCPMPQADYFFDVRRRLKDLSQRSPISFKFHRIERSILEAVLCRGDRRLGKVIHSAWRNGARMDSWDEHFDYDKWAQAFQETGIDPAFYAHRDIPVDQLLPWSHIRCPRTEEFLKTQYAAMKQTIESV